MSEFVPHVKVGERYRHVGETSDAYAFTVLKVKDAWTEVRTPEGTKEHWLLNEFGHYTYFEKVPEDPRVAVLVNGLKAIADMNEQNRDLADAKVMARRTLRDANIELKKVQA